MAGTAAARTHSGRHRQVERRAERATAVVLLGLTALAWWSTVDASRGMSSMVSGLADVGRDMPFTSGAVLFLSTWTTMMVAMMLPTVAPIVLLHRLVTRRRGEGPLTTVVFTGGYLTVWAALGVAPLLALLAFRSVTEPADWVARLAGLVLVVAGAYQFTSWKDTCLRACRSPLTFLATHDFGCGRLGAARAGVSHGLFCAGCCWALMAVLFSLGLMNLVWMAAIAVVFLAEKTWRHGVGLTRVVGTGLVVLGLAMLVHPPLLGAVAGAETAPAGPTAAPRA